MRHRSRALQKNKTSVVLQSSAQVVVYSSTVSDSLLLHRGIQRLHHRVRHQEAQQRFHLHQQALRTLLMCCRQLLIPHVGMHRTQVRLNLLSFVSWKCFDCSDEANGVHAGSLEALLDNLEQLESGLWPPKRPRSSFIYFSAASKAAIQQQIVEEEQILQQKEREQEPEQQGHQVESADTRTAGQQKTKPTAAVAARNGSNRRKKSRFSELLSLSWRNLCAEERQVYEKLAAADHARFERERDIWARSHQESYAMRQQRMWEESQGAQTTQSRGEAGVWAARAVSPSTSASDSAIGSRDAEQQQCLIKREPGEHVR